MDSVIKLLNNRAGVEHPKSFQEGMGSNPYQGLIFHDHLISKHRIKIYTVPRFII